MHHGIYKGIAADKSAKRILILGESHHGKDEEKGIPALYTTQEVVETYLSEKVTKRNLEIFHKIAQSFGVDTTKEEEDNTIHYYLPINCSSCELYARWKMEKDE